MRRAGIPNRPYTAAEIETAVRMSIAGHHASVIAGRLGRSKASVRGKLDHLGIPTLVCNGQSRGLRTAVPADAFCEIEAEASRRQMSAPTLSAKLLATIARDRLFRSILDL